MTTHKADFFGIQTFQDDDAGYMRNHKTEGLPVYPSMQAAIQVKKDITGIADLSPQPGRRYLPYRTYKQYSLIKSQQSQELFSFSGACICVFLIVLLRFEHEKRNWATFRICLEKPLHAGQSARNRGLVLTHRNDCYHTAQAVILKLEESNSCHAAKIRSDHHNVFRLLDSLVCTDFRN